MNDSLLRMLAEAQQDERDAVRRGDEDVLRLVRNRIANLEKLIARQQS